MMSTSIFVIYNDFYYQLDLDYIIIDKTINNILYLNHIYYIKILQYGLMLKISFMI